MSFLQDWIWVCDCPNDVLGIDLTKGFQKIGLESITRNARPTPFCERAMALIIFGVLWSLPKETSNSGLCFGYFTSHLMEQKVFSLKKQNQSRLSLLGNGSYSSRSDCCQFIFIWSDRLGPFFEKCKQAHSRICQTVSVALDTLCHNVVELCREVGNRK